MNPVPASCNPEPGQHPRNLPQKLPRLPRRRTPDHHQPLRPRCRTSQHMVQSLSRRHRRLPPLSRTVQNPPPGLGLQYPNLRLIRLKPGLASERDNIRPPRLHSSANRRRNRRTRLPLCVRFIESPARPLPCLSHAQFVSPRVNKPEPANRPRNERNRIKTAPAGAEKISQLIVIGKSDHFRGVPRHRCFACCSILRLPGGTPLSMWIVKRYANPRSSRYLTSPVAYAM